MTHILLLLFGITLYAACGNPEGNASASATANTSEASSEFDAIAECLASKDYNYEELLTKADIAKHISIDESSYKKDVSSTQGKYGSCVYRWKSDRPDKEITSVVTGAVHKRPDKNEVTIKLLDFYDDDDLNRYEQGSALELFDQSYKKLSAAEHDEILANMEKKLGDKPEDLARAKKMMDSRMKFTYESVEELADRAYWKWSDEYGIELIVLAGTARFTILSKTTAEPETSLDHAVKFAKEVLAKCKG